MASQKILVDTDILINFLRGQPLAKHLLDAAVTGADLYLSVVTLAELLASMRPSEEKVTEDLMGGFSLIPVTEPIARLSGALRYRHKKVMLPDCLIAATALHEEALLLTGNRKDYPFEGLQFFKG